MARTVNPEMQKLAMSGLINAGIKDIASKGLDQISVQSVTIGAKTSRPTFYSYFGDINGLLAEIWLAKSDAWLEMIVDFEKPILKLDKEGDVLNKAMTQILAASHRIPELNEIVQPRLLKWWKSLSGLPVMAQLKILWLVGERLGVTLTAYSNKDAHKAAFIESVIRSIDDNHMEKLEAPALPLLSEPELDSPSLESKLLNSAIEIIASSGVAAASMARVARKAQVSTGAVYPRFSKVDNLIENSFDVAVRGVIYQNFSLLNAKSFESDDFGTFVKAGLLPSRRVWRNFRIEIHLGALSRPKLAKKLSESLVSTNAMVAQKLVAFDLPELVKEPIPFLVHSVGIGLAILQNAGIPVGALDHRLISREMVRISVNSSK